MPTTHSRDVDRPTSVRFLSRDDVFDRIAQSARQRDEFALRAYVLMLEPKGILSRACRRLWFAVCLLLLVLCAVVSGLAFANSDYIGGFFMLGMALGVPLLYRS